MASRRRFLVAGLVFLLHFTASCAPSSARTADFLRLPVPVEGERLLNPKANLTELDPQAAVVEFEVRRSELRTIHEIASTFLFFYVQTEGRQSL